MSHNPRRQSIVLLVVAATALVLTVVVPWAGAVEPLDEAAPVTTIVDTAVDAAAPAVPDEIPITTTSTTATTTSTTTTSTTTTTSPPTDSSTGSPATVSRDPGPAPGPDTVAETPVAERSIDPAPVAAPGDLDLPERPMANLGPLLDRTGDFSPPERPVARGPRSTVDVLEVLDGLGATPSLVAKVLAPFPVAGPANYSNDWHAPRHGGRLHQGTDIFARRGTPVIAAADGVVGNMTTTAVLGGTTLRVTTDNGTFFYYAHLSAFAAGLANGDEVSAGDVIGFVGNTGNAISTPPHLHFEIHPRGGAAAPPVPFLDRWLDDARTRAAAMSDAPAIDALVRPGVLGSPPPLVTFDVVERDGGPATKLALSQGGPPPIDPMPLAILILPAAFVARRAFRSLRQWQAAR